MQVLETLNGIQCLAQRASNPCIRLRTLAGCLCSHITVVTVSLKFALGRWRGEMQWRGHSAGKLPSLQGWGSGSTVTYRWQTQCMETTSHLSNPLTTHNSLTVFLTTLLPLRKAWRL